MLIICRREAFFESFLNCGFLSSRHSFAAAAAGLKTGFSFILLTDSFCIWMTCLAECQKEPKPVRRCGYGEERLGRKVVGSIPNAGKDFPL